MTRTISKNLSHDEVVCRCGECQKYSADVELVFIIQGLRDYYESPVHVHSWFRCWEHNNRPKDKLSKNGIRGAGSNNNSWHLYGGACDFHINGVSNVDIRKHLRKKYPNKLGIGIYDLFLHVDVRPFRADWDNRT